MRCYVLSAVISLTAIALLAQSQKQAQRPSEAEQAISKQIGGLRSIPDDQRGAVTKRLALEIRNLPDASVSRLGLANGLANLSTEGDFGHDTLQTVATTLASAIRENTGQAVPASAFEELASLVRYEHVDASLDVPEFHAAVSKLEAADRARQDANFTLQDLQGNSWTLKDLGGKVALVNFWATWCPPCRKEMPDLEALGKRFKDQGLVILAISDEDAAKVKPFIAERQFTFPVLLDPGRKVNKLFDVEGIPKTFIYDREGRLSAQAIDMRTEHQLLEMLGRAGIR
ncbi:MAG: TlpA disulfide reductase family protein [Bryobacteraceae bacterium]|jgi:peroxiredoxin